MPRDPNVASWHRVKENLSFELVRLQIFQRFRFPQERDHFDNLVGCVCTEKKKNFLGLEEMKLRRTELQAQIESQEEEKNNLQREIEKMSCKLTQLNDSLAKRITVRNEYDRTIADTEAAYIKVKVFAFLSDLLNRTLIIHLSSVLFVLL